MSGTSEISRCQSDIAHAQENARDQDPHGIKIKIKIRYDVSLLQTLFTSLRRRIVARNQDPLRRLSTPP
ncbi:hypothetical protein Dimus_005785 [Dionaea muscipula]